MYLSTVPLWIGLSPLFHMEDYIKLWRQFLKKNKTTFWQLCRVHPLVNILSRLLDPAFIKYSCFGTTFVFWSTRILNTYLNTVFPSTPTANLNIVSPSTPTTNLNTVFPSTPTTRVSTKWLIFLLKICAIFAQIFFCELLRNFCAWNAISFVQFFWRNLRKTGTITQKVTF